MKRLLALAPVIAPVLALAACNATSGGNEEFTPARGALPAGVEIPAGFSRSDVLESDGCYYVLEAGAYTQIGCAA